MLTDFAIEAALYGNMVVRIGAPKTPGGHWAMQLRHEITAVSSQ